MIDPRVFKTNSRSPSEVANRLADRTVTSPLLPPRVLRILIAMAVVEHERTREGDAP